MGSEVMTMHLQATARHWWVPLVRGLAAILFGALAILWPGTTLTILVALFGAFALVDGVFAVIGGFRTNHVWTVVEGAVGIALGFIIFFWPGITALVLLYLIAMWAVLTGIAEIAAAVALRRVLSNEWLLALGGVTSIVFGVVLVLFPGTGILALVWLLGGFAILFGLAMVGLGLRLRSAQRQVA